MISHQFLTRAVIINISGKQFPDIKGSHEKQHTGNSPLPKGFSISTNKGLRGDMQFFEFQNHQLTTEAPEFEKDKVCFAYKGCDSDEGTVFITYTNIEGNDALDAFEGSGDWDVEVTTGSDVWGLSETQSAINDAITLHKALGRDAIYKM